ncbi:MAG: hypothetical protein ACRENC_14165, partial [Gemmatimonadaceae bacterium]
MTTVRTDVRRLRAVDQSALDTTQALRMPCLIVEVQRGSSVVHGDLGWSAPEQPSGVGNAGWRWDGERLRAHTGRYGFR